MKLCNEYYSALELLVCGKLEELNVDAHFPNINWRLPSLISGTSSLKTLTCGISSIYVPQLLENTHLSKLGITSGYSVFTKDGVLKLMIIRQDPRVTFIPLCIAS